MAIDNMNYLPVHLIIIFLFWHAGSDWIVQSDGNRSPTSQSNPKVFFFDSSADNTPNVRSATSL